MERVSSPGRAAQGRGVPIPGSLMFRRWAGVVLGDRAQWWHWRVFPASLILWFHEAGACCFFFEGASVLLGTTARASWGFIFIRNKASESWKCCLCGFKDLSSSCGDWGRGEWHTEKISFRQLRNHHTFMINFLFPGWMQKLLVRALLFHTWHEQWEYLFCPGGLHLPLI